MVFRICVRGLRSTAAAMMVVASIAMVGCGDSSTAESTSNLKDVIGGVGSTFVDPAMKSWATAFHNAHPDSEVHYRAEGSAAGIEEIKASMTAFAASDAPLTDEELSKLPPILQVPVAAGPVCVLYNLPQLKSPLRLSGKTLSDIFIGDVVTWNDPAIARENPGVTLPRAAIIVVHRSDGSGTTSILTTYFSKVNPEWSKKAGSGLSVHWGAGFGAKGSAGVIELVKQATGTIGYAELSYAKSEGLSVASIQNRAGTYIEPSISAASAALDSFSASLTQDMRSPIVDPPASAKEAYPICGLTFLLIPKDGSAEADRKTLEGFARYVVTDGQFATKGLYYAAIPKLLQEQDLKLISQMTIGGRAMN